MMLLLLTILLVFAGAVNSQSYSASVQDLFKDLQAEDQKSSTCVTKAMQKANSFSNTEDNKHAVALINLYTQDCKLTSGILYGVLNSNLRSGQPKPIWKRTEDLLNQGISLLGMSTFTDLYRGCTNTLQFQPGTPYHFSQFISTSTDISVAKQFAGNGANALIFFIKNARGLSIQQFSQFPSEKEVLLKSSSTFTVQSVDVYNGIKKVVLQYTGRRRRSDTSVIEASFCDSDTSSGAAFLTTSSIMLFVSISVQLVKAVL